MANQKTPQKPKSIRISGARTNTLKNVHCDLPHRQFTVITGPSGSGKSSLAFDTLYAEGQRRYIESMSAYARQFLERIQKPDVDQIQHVLPAIALEQKNRINNARSTVGTATEIYDYLRLLFANVGKTICHACGSHNVSRANQHLIEKTTKSLKDGAKLLILAPITLSDISQERLRQLGYFRVYFNNEIQEVDTIATQISKNTVLPVVVDRLIIKEKEASRLRESVEQALSLGKGNIQLKDLTNDKEYTFQTEFACQDCGTEHKEPEAIMFSFNSPLGACPSCEGFGRIIGTDWSKIIPNKELSLEDGAVHPFTTPANQKRFAKLLQQARDNNVPTDKPYKDLTDDQKAFVMNGTGRYKGVRGFFKEMERKRYKMHVRVMLAKYRDFTDCPDCEGSRLKKEALHVEIGGMTIWDLCNKPIDTLLDFFNQNDLFSEKEWPLVEAICREITGRLSYLNSVGLEYLTLSRQSRTLSGGEAQRINLSTALGTSLTETLYVLDEPTVGLHARDTERLLNILYTLRDKGNTVVVVEHDPDVIKGADHIVDMGPGGGEEGGRIIFEGNLKALVDTKFSLTAQYLNNPPKPETTGNTKLIKKQKDTIEILDAHGNNLKHIDVAIPKNKLVCVTGVSGSGKSTLIKQTLYVGHKRSQGKELQEDMAPCGSINGLDGFDDVVMVDQSPPGRSQRSNPVTYVKAWDDIRKCFSDNRKAAVIGLKPSDFSFNTPGGRCETCEGLGTITIDMQFMADVTVTCHDCKGRRFNQNVLSVEVEGPDNKSKNINDVLNMTVDEAVAFFKSIKRITNKLKPLQDIGLGYLKLGQSTSTLSGGEAQRLKLASYLRQENKGCYCFLFDEPTTGLHMADIDRLVGVFRRLVDAGHSVIVIEHNIEFIARCDWLIDMGPEGGEGGGTIVAEGSVEDIIKSSSHTGKHLTALLNDRETSLV